MRKINILLFFCVSVIVNLNAQDTHLSQYFTNDHFLNPAKIGNHDGDYRFCANYRNQWRQISNQPLTTIMVGFDKAFHYYSHEIDAGIALVRDQFAGFQTNVTGFLVSGAYAKTINKNTFRGGFQTGIVSNSTNLDLQTFPNQWDYQKGTFDKGLSNQETSIKASQFYWDVNLGGLWTRKINKMTLSTGLGLSHINRPKDTYFAEHIERRRVRKILHSTLAIPFAKKFSIEPQFNWMFTSKANEFLFGSNLKYMTGNSKIPMVYGGVFYRHGIVRTVDAVYPTIGLSYKQFNFGFSYDINVSELSQNLKRLKTVEFSLVYTSLSNKPKYKILPCTRM